jgi:hypothetical protein
MSSRSENGEIYRTYQRHHDNALESTYKSEQYSVHAHRKGVTYESAMGDLEQAVETWPFKSMYPCALEKASYTDLA